MSIKISRDLQKMLLLTTFEWATLGMAAVLICVIAMVWWWFWLQLTQCTHGPAQKTYKIYHRQAYIYYTHKRAAIYSTYPFALLPVLCKYLARSSYVPSTRTMGTNCIILYCTYTAVEIDTFYSYYVPICTMYKLAH